MTEIADLQTSLPISAVERETGITKEVLRKWESRYGFPLPDRDETGERLYPQVQVDRLRLIKRLLDAGMRPAKVVGLAPDQLSAMANGRLASARSTGPVGQDDFETYLHALRQHDTGRLRRVLLQEMYRVGVSEFVQDRMARLIVQVGERWSLGELDIHEEHLLTEAIQSVLNRVIDDLNDPDRRPNLLLTSLPGEPHGLGLLMVAAMAALEGSYCLYLGTQTPVREILAAVQSRSVDIVVLSFSSNFPGRRIAPAIEQLREVLPPRVDIWVGGAGVVRPPADIPGLTHVASLDQVAPAVMAWREAAPGLPG